MNGMILETLNMTSSKSFKPGDIVLVHFPFTDLENSKKRPALVLRETTYSRSMKLVTIAMITSQIELPEIDGDHLIKDWKHSGLLHPSRLRMSKIATLEDTLVTGNLGKFSSTDLKSAKKIFRKLYQGWLV